MFTTKKEVDKHVRTTLAKLRTDNEKLLRGVTIAKLYFKICDYNSALHFVSGYLTVKNDSSAAYKLQGQCYEKLNKIENALKSYKQSLKLDTKQFDLLNHVCKLVLANEKLISSGQADFWSDFASAQNCQHESVLNLKLKIMDRNNVDPQQIQDLILGEILTRPTDVSLRIRLLKHYLEQNRVNDAFRYAYDIEMKQNEFFAQSIDWYNAISSVLNKCKVTDHQTKWPYWLLSILTLERQCFLKLCNSDLMKQQQNSNLTECANLLFELDQTLCAAASVVLVLCSERELAAQFLQHYRGQLCLHAATFIFKRERIQQTQNHDTTYNALTLLLVAYNCGIVSNDEPWLRNSNETTRQLIRLWSQEGAFRCSQSGRTLLSCIDDDQQNNSVMANIRKICTDWTTRDELINQIRRLSSNTEWRKNLFRILFASRDHLSKQSSSHLWNCTEMDDINYELPRVSDLDTYEECAQWLRPSSLQHMVYLCIGATNIEDLTCHTFNGLNLSISNLLNCGADTLNQLDIDTFLYATTIQAKRCLEIERTTFETINKGKNFAKPKLLPFANISSSLATEEQSAWWLSAYKVCKNISGEDLAEVRQQLQYGIEAIRGVGGPKMDILICLKLGKLFWKRAQNSTKVVERGFLDARTGALFKFSLYMLKMQNSRNIEPFNRLFKYVTNNIVENEKEIDNLAEDAITFIASQYFASNQYEECIDELSNIQLPFATYFIAKAYRKMEESNQTPKKNKRIYIDKAKEYMQQTLTLLDHPNVDQNHPLRGMVHTDIKQLQQHSTSLNSSFLNGTQYAEESINESYSHRQRRDITGPSNADEMRLLNQMMEMLTFVKEDVANVLGRMDRVEDRMSRIEEHLNKKQDMHNVDAAGLDEFLNLDDDLQAHGFMNNSAMYQNYAQQRIHTPTQMIPQMMPGVNAAHTSQPVHPYVNQFYNSAYQMGMNQYQAALMTPQRTSLVMQQPIPYPDVSYNSQLTDPRNSFIGLLTQQPTSQPPVSAMSTMATMAAMPTLPPQPTTPVLPTTDNRPQQNNNFVRTWNSSFNNAPIDKTPPINVVITNSEPLPLQTTITSQPALSVTIPSHHIKNTIASNEPATFSFQTSSHSQQVVTTTAQTVKDLLKSTPTKPFSTPVVSSAQDKSKETSSKSTKPNPFANFSFGSISTSTPSGNTNIFGSLNKTTAEANIPKTAERPNEATSANNSVAKEEHEEEYVPTAEFAPVISLPDLIEVKTGEEEEIVKFEYRAKLLRYVKDSKEWKERGVGNMKLLINRNDPNKVRLLMRRDQVLKLCCNQLISKDTKFNKLPKIDTALSWYGQDFSENELQTELFAVRFKTADTCKEFHNAILEAQKNMKDAPENESNIAADTNTITKSKKEPAKSKGFGNQFKPASGSWNCEGCYLSNKADDQKCAACNAPKDKPIISTQPKQAPVTVANNGFGDKFKPKAGTWECQLCYISNKAGDDYCLACESPKDDTVPKKEPKNLLNSLTSATTPKFSFGVPSSVPATNTSTTATTFPTTTSFSFGAFTAMTTNNAPSNATTTSVFGNLGPPKVGGFSFGGVGLNTKSPFDVDATGSKDLSAKTDTSFGDFPAKLEPKEKFSFVFKPKSPGKAKSPLKSTDGLEDISDEENIEEENTTYFTPVIALPEKIEVKTGEEDEESLYSHRAKLFRFAEGEWKERGLGDVKILKHKETGKLRVVMRREQILKICLNHVLNEEVEYKVKDDKSWHFIVNDFSEGEVELMQFCLRFKTSEIAQNFRQAVRDVLAGKTDNTTSNGIDDSAGSSEEKDLVEKLKLPSGFYDFESPCKGCRGCNSDDFVFPEYKDINSDVIDDNPLPLIQPIKQFSISTTSKPLLTTFGQLSKSNETPRNIFGSFNKETSGQSLFTQLSFSPTTNQTTSIFGNNGNVTTNIFGGNKPMFSNTNEEKSTPSSNADDVKNSFSFASFASPIKPSIFGQNVSGQTAAPTISFGTNNPIEKNVETEPAKTFSFGEKLASTTSTTNIFGNFSQQPKDDNSKAIPVSNAQTVFGTTVKESNKFASTPIFGSSTIVPQSTSNTSKFSFGNPTITEYSSPLKDNGLSFSALAKSPESGSNKSTTEKTENLFKLDSDLSFATLAQSTVTFTNTTTTDPKSGFFGLSNTNAFSNFQQKRNEGTEENAAVDDSNYDPHYDPIIALPDEIVVTSGEEDEQKLFGERAKLYRYDATNKEWKERGVGEMKILYHPVNGTYRFLLRREQIFKCVLNHQLSADLSVNPMKTSDKAFVWAAHNHGEDSNGELEQLSVRFKNVAIATTFDNVVKSCLEKLKAKSDGLEPEDD